MRNQQRGGITINGVTGAPVDAYLYWAVITLGPPTPATHGRRRIQRIGPGASSANQLVTGTVVGTGPTPCWPGDRLTVWRARVPLAVASGNGLYRVTSLGGTSSFAGEDPWEAGLPAPFDQGASLVIIYQDDPNKVTEIYDAGLSGSLYFGSPGVGYTNVLTFPAAGPVKWDNITADGQKGAGRSATAGTADESTYLDGVQVAGPGSPANDSDQNGNDSTPVPSLWDTRGHEVSGIGTDGDIFVSISSASFGLDCLSAVANIVNYPFVWPPAPAE
jgi:hypothetical protein